MRKIKFRGRRKDNVAGVVKMTKICVDGRITNIPFEHSINESFEGFSFLNITAYIGGFYVFEL